MPRTFNQFEEVYNVTELAEKIQRVGKGFGLSPEVRCIENPRVEQEDHHYNPDHQNLLDLGYQPTRNMDDELENMLADLIANKERIASREEAVFPDIRWDGTRERSEYLT